METDTILNKSSKEKMTNLLFLANVYISWIKGHFSMQASPNLFVILNNELVRNRNTFNHFY